MCKRTYLVNLFIFILLICTNNAIVAAPDNLVRDPFENGNRSDSLAKDLKDIFVHIHYANASEIAKVLLNKNSKMLSEDGSVNVDKRTNSLWLQDFDSNLIKIKKFIQNIDKPLTQVIITAKIVNVDENFTRQLGIEWSTVKNGSKNNAGLNMDLPTPSVDPGHFSFLVAELSNDNLLEMELTALESEGKGKIISSPKLITLDHETAFIESGDEVPYQEKTGEGDTSVSFKKAVLGLKVTPEIVDAQKLILTIEVNQDKVSALVINGEPSISTRKIKTKVLVNNKQTVVLGGIYEEAKNNLESKIPGLGSIPFFGAAFRYNRIINERKELLIFITPEIRPLA